LYQLAIDLSEVRKTFLHAPRT